MLSTQKTTSYSRALYYCPPNDCIQHELYVSNDIYDVCTINIKDYISNPAHNTEIESILFCDGHYTVYLFDGSKILNLGRYTNRTTAEYVYLFSTNNSRCRTKEEVQSQLKKLTS